MDALLSDDKIDATVKATEELITKNCEQVVTDRRGKRRLAFEINKKTHGDYTVFSFLSEGGFISELNKKLRYNESVLRFLTTQCAEKEQKESDS
jgi:small subunit ribosomal protein S6